MPNQVTVVGHSDELQDFVTKQTDEMFEHALFEDMRGDVLWEGQQKVVQ